MRRSASRYQVRTDALAEIGFASYRAYLASPLWASIRGRILARDNGLCVMCHRPAVSVHHTTYRKDVLLGNDDSQLVSSCGGCHKCVEFDGDKKLTYTTDIYGKFSRRAIKKLGGKASKALRKSKRPRCRSCGRQFRSLGRNDICLGCHKSGKASEFANSPPLGKTA